MIPITDKAVMHAAQVVVRCLTDQLGPADVMATMPALRSESGDVRAWVVRVASAVIAGRRRLRFLLGDDRPRDAHDRARLYVCLSLVESGEKSPVEPSELPSFDEISRRLLSIEDPDQRFAVKHSLPDWLAMKIRATFEDYADPLLDAMSSPAPRTVRFNRLRIPSREALIERMRGEGVLAEAADHADTAVHVRNTHDLFQTQAYRDGCFEQQDEASQLAVMATAPPPGGKVLDMCCGSGGKTLGLASLLANRGVILAADVHKGRMQQLRKRLVRAGADNVRPLWLDGSPAAELQLQDFAQHADRILIDAPCSGTGSWRRRPQARWNLDERGFAEMQATQIEMLRRAAGWLKPGARLVYATCSLLPEENERQVERVCAEFQGLEPVRLVEIMGGSKARSVSDPTGTWLSVRPDIHGCDGFFLAVLRRVRRVPEDVSP